MTLCVSIQVFPAPLELVHAMNLGLNPQHNAPMPQFYGPGANTFNDVGAFDLNWARIMFTCQQLADQAALSERGNLQNLTFSSLLMGAPVSATAGPNTHVKSNSARTRCRALFHKQLHHARLH